MEHTIHSKASPRELISQRYDDSVQRAYECLRPYSYKADLGRYCLRHALGGWYVDIAVRIVRPVHVGDDVDWLAFRDIQRHNRMSCACSTTVLYSKPGNPVLETAIRMIVENCRRRYYGITPLCPTGPALLGRALALHGGSLGPTRIRCRRALRPGP